ncbi:MAG: UvrD-helicase domain-containing protein, partial [bacterium]|nr:UvrD-helicase domain-containing protein [bacterium]
MPDQVLTKDNQIRFPDFTLLKASAGSGKTHNLTLRYLQFFLSKKIGNNDLRNILAITFSNNAANEMKDRILGWLKEIYFGNQDRIIDLNGLLTGDKKELTSRAEDAISLILSHYTDFQVKTIDSFMSSIFKASAIDLGYPPQFEILMDNSQLIEYAFNLYLKRVKLNSPESYVVEKIIDDILATKQEQQAYLWEPTGNLLKEMKSLYKKLSSINKEVSWSNYPAQFTQLKKQLQEQIQTLDTLISRSGLELTQKSTFPALKSAVNNGGWGHLTDCAFTAMPVKKAPRKDAEYTEIEEQWKRLGELIKQYRYYYSHSFYAPYLEMYNAIKGNIESVKKQEAQVFIEDITKKLAEYINRGIVPDIYFRLGDTIYHYLIDEFQDTSPIQWHNLVPLIDNSLSQGGSLFIVGDTKQAIYGFRNAEYKIMKRLETGEETPFPSISQERKLEPIELPINYRSYQRLVEFPKNVFQKKLPELNKEEYTNAANKSGLTDYKQEVKKGYENKGYVEVNLFLNPALTLS